MIVVVLLHAPAAYRISAALDGHARVIALQTGERFAIALKKETADVAVVDPSVDSAQVVSRVGLNPVVRALSDATAPPFVLYLSDGRAPVALRAALVRLGPTMVLAKGIDDNSSQLKAILEEATISRVPDGLVLRLSNELARLRSRVRQALADVLRAPLECNSVSALAGTVGLSERALSREFKEAGLAPPRDWLAVARVLRAHWELRDPSIRIRQVVALMGYSSEEPFSHDVAKLTRGTPSGLRRLSSQELITVAAERLVLDPTRLAGEVGRPIVIDPTADGPAQSAG